MALATCFARLRKEKTLKKDTHQTLQSHVAIAHRHEIRGQAHKKGKKEKRKKEGGKSRSKKAYTKAIDFFQSAKEKK